ncbi:hypothetical protein OAM67_01455 [bacterium]|nr:hypothetical protein [bacterium]
MPRQVVTIPKFEHDAKHMTTGELKRSLVTDFDFTEKDIQFMRNTDLVRLHEWAVCDNARDVSTPKTQRNPKKMLKSELYFALIRDFHYHNRDLLRLHRGDLQKLYERSLRANKAREERVKSRIRNLAKRVKRKRSAKRPNATDRTTNKTAPDTDRNKEVRAQRRAQRAPIRSACKRKAGKARRCGRGSRKHKACATKDAAKPCRSKKTGTCLAKPQ